MSDIRNRCSGSLHLGALLLLTVLLMGCSGGSGPTTPGPGAPGPAIGASAVVDGSTSGRISWGLWNITIDTRTLSAEVVPLREGQLHYNVLQMLEGWACADCVTVDSISWSPEKTMLVDVSIRHPYPPDRLDLTGRDVWGVVIFDGIRSFPNHCTRDADGVDEPLLASRRLLNADGYTTHFNRWTAHEGTRLFEYKRGRLTHPSEAGIVGNLHPFKEFHTHEYKRLFYPSYTVTRTYELDIGRFEWVTFAYSVDANWSLPLRWPVVNPITDFNVSANAREAFQISVEVADNQLTQQGGHADLVVDIFDHQGYDTISAITIEAPDLFYGVGNVDPASYTMTDDEMARYNITINNTTGHAKTADGGSDLLIVVKDIGHSVVGEDVRGYNIFTLPVAEQAYEWRPRDGTFLSSLFPGPDPGGSQLDMTVVRDPQIPWAFSPGEPMLVFNDDDNEQYLGCNRDFDQWAVLAGYPGTPTSFLLPTRRLDAAGTGAFGVVSDSDVEVDDPYLVRHCINAHRAGGLYMISWYTGSMNDPVPHLEIGAGVSGGFGHAIGDPIYGIYLYDISGGPPAPIYQSLHRIETPYNDPSEVMRAFVPLADNLSGAASPYGVSSRYFMALGVDDEPVGESNPYTVHVYTAENETTGPGYHIRELDVWKVNFANPTGPSRIRTYHSALLGASLPVPVVDQWRLVDVDVLPAGADNVYMGNGEFAQHNWVAILYTRDVAAEWFVEIFDVHLDDANAWRTPLYSLGPHPGRGMALDVDAESFEVYILHDDGPIGIGAMQLTCYEYY